MSAWRGRRSLLLAFVLSLLVHLIGFGVQAWQDSADEPAVHSAPRLMARLAASQTQTAEPAPVQAESPKARHPQRKSVPPPPEKNATLARLPPPAGQSMPPNMETVRSLPDVAESAPGSTGPEGLEQGAIPSQESAPVAAGSAVPAPVSGSEPTAQESIPAEVSAPAAGEAVIQLPVAQRLPAQGEISYLGTAGGFLALTATGRASWQHDGTHFQSTLSAGLTSPDSSLDYRSSGRLVDLQMISERSRDNRRGKISTSVIDQGAGKVFMQRGTDQRERDIRGFAVALSALPEMLMTLDEHIDKAAFFVVGDFWVDDAIVVQRPKDYLRLPVGRVQARHFAMRTKKGDLIDVWLAPQWRDAPVRIRIEASGIVVDLQATEVRIDGETLVSTSETP